MIFLDTSAIYAMADKADPNHATACSKFALALKSKEPFLLHNYILAESAALLQARLGLQPAILFLNDAQAFEIEWVDSELHHPAQRELNNLVELGIVKKQETNNRVYYQINTASPFFNPLKSILAFTTTT